MAANINPTTFTNLTRLRWAVYANEEMSAVFAVSPAELEREREEFRLICIFSGAPFRAVQPFFENGTTLRELRLRSACQLTFDRLSVDHLQSHFTYFYNKGREIKRREEAATAPDIKKELGCEMRANSLLVDELGRSLQRQGTQPRVPSSP